MSQSVKESKCAIKVLQVHIRFLFVNELENKLAAHLIDLFKIIFAN